MASLMELVKNHLEAKIGGLGGRIYQKSISELNLDKNPSREEIENLIIDLERKVTKLYGINKSKLIFKELRKELIEFDKFLEYKIKDTLENFFEMNGIPGNSDIQQIADSLLSDSYDMNKKELIKKIQQFSEEKIIHDIKCCMISNEIKLFLDNNPKYTQADVEALITHIRAKKINMKGDDVKNEIEKERLFRKFNYLGRKENKEEKISRQYIELLNSNRRNDFKYIKIDRKLSKLIEGLFSDTMNGASQVE